LYLSWIQFLGCCKCLEVSKVSENLNLVQVSF